MVVRWLGLLGEDAGEMVRLLGLRDDGQRMGSSWVQARIGQCRERVAASARRCRLPRRRRCGRRSEDRRLCAPHGPAAASSLGTRRWMDGGILCRHRHTGAGSSVASPRGDGISRTCWGRKVGRNGSHTAVGSRRKSFSCSECRTAGLFSLRLRKRRTLMLEWRYRGRTCSLLVASIGEGGLGRSVSVLS